MFQLLLRHVQYSGWPLVGENNPPIGGQIVNENDILESHRCRGGRGERQRRRRVGREESVLVRGEGRTGMWLDGILGKVCNSLSHSLDLSWGQIPHGAERKPAGVCRATSTQECFSSNGKCSQLLVRLSLLLCFSIYLSISPSLCQKLAAMFSSTPRVLVINSIFSSTVGHFSFIFLFQYPCDIRTSQMFGHTF